MQTTTTAAATAVAATAARHTPVQALDADDGAAVPLPHSKHVVTALTSAPGDAAGRYRPALHATQYVLAMPALGPGK
jgi:hypothetical protein